MRGGRWESGRGDIGEEWGFQIWLRRLKEADGTGVLDPAKLSFCCLREGVELAGVFLETLTGFLFEDGADTLGWAGSGLSLFLETLLARRLSSEAGEKVV